jgi:hypothetical protein
MPLQQLARLARLPSLILVLVAVVVAVAQGHLEAVLELRHLVLLVALVLPAEAVS